MIYFNPESGEYFESTLDYTATFPQGFMKKTIGVVIPMRETGVAFPEFFTWLNMAEERVSKLANFKHYVQRGKDFCTKTWDTEKYEAVAKQRNDGVEKALADGTNGFYWFKTVKMVGGAVFAKRQVFEQLSKPYWHTINGANEDLGFHRNVAEHGFHFWIAPCFVKEVV